MVSLHLVNIAQAGPDLRWCFVRAGQARVAAQSSSRMDKLTLLPNYEALLLHLTALLQARREGLDQSSPSAPVLFYVNVDNMSAINALAGHAQGDLVLQHVARQLQLLQPFQGYAARVAGDKFALVLRQCSPEKAHELAAQLCDTLQNWQPQLRSKHFVVTVSIGLLQMDASFTDALQVVRAADMASYSAKRQGGNRACWREAKVA
jgi:diguanylate cyclase (GGDEF)-like protein